ncbi:MAG: hypothetical protein FJZ63_05625 [Chlamydiae bacterium]|nr:hypothetical protein [Chlamydiota bacterium]
MHHVCEWNVAAITKFDNYVRQFYPHSIASYYADDVWIDWEQVKGYFGIQDTVELYEWLHLFSQWKNHVFLDPSPQSSAVTESGNNPIGAAQKHKASDDDEEAAISLAPQQRAEGVKKDSSLTGLDLLSAMAVERLAPRSRLPLLTLGPAKGSGQ